ncbi:riboflavin synthase [Moraxella bovis]|uniref:riboflavin synthase n=1 Tax=Moraxella bovis TaxID=476 RepID=UPI000993591D|nr:riboflavin synthase [Moraxella bovis]AWY21569.1 riboflavin synthase [Moraxella bovis]OOR87617.1 riboflavin synthase [Moraxella bovis]UZA16754.1 riboflavin synthase [Moraxella bovis]
MFTGIIETTGTLIAITPTGGDVQLTISAPELDFGDVKLGDSIASNGICLTVVAIDGNSYAVDVSRETLAISALNVWKVGDTLNLEKAMLPTTRFGGHIVAGHVDGVGKIAKIAKDARSVYIEVALPSELMKYTADKGSITVDGISLTTNRIKPSEHIVCLNIIPHTAEMTNIARHWAVGRAVNIEVDLVARYLERLIGAKIDTPQGNITEELLIKSGFFK